MQNLFEGLKIIDITNNLAGPGAAAMFGDYGAEVIHIEKPVYGDDCRGFPPMVEGQSTCSWWINRGKKSLVLDLKDPRAIDVVKKLVADADVFIESNRPGVMGRLGLSYDVLKEINPSLIYCSVSAFGQTGPYSKRPGYDVISQAFSGVMTYTGSPEGGPTKIGFTIGDVLGMYNAYGAISAALYHRAVTGKGQYIDVNLARGMVWAVADFNHVFTGQKKRRMGNFDGQLCPYGVFRGKNDQAIVIGAVNVRLWQQLCIAMKREDLMSDPRYVTNDKRVENQKEVIEIVTQWLETFDDISDAAKILTELGIPNCKLYTMEDIYDDPHANECGWLREIPVPDGIKSFTTFKSKMGTAEYYGAELLVQKAPNLGQHSIELLMECGYTAEEAEALESEWETKVKG